MARGLRAEDDAVTVVGVSGSAEVVYADGDDADELLSTLAHAMVSAGNVGAHGLIGGGSPLVVLSPEHAQALAAAGLDRAAVQRALWERAVLPLDALAGAQADRVRRARRDAHSDAEAPLRVAAAPDDILVAVAGGVGVKSTYLPSWGGGTRAVTAAV